MGNLSGKTAIVTGASSGIGLAIAKRLGAKGANVVLAGRKRENMDAAAKEIQSGGGKASVHPVDVTDEKGVIALVDAAVEEFGKLDIMINNAGYNPFDKVIDGGDYARWKETLEVNVLGTALGMREAVRVMKGKGGHIVNITSVAARYSEPDDPMYAASKYAAGALTESIRLALVGQNIRVTAIMPGAVATNLVRSMPREQLFGIARMLGQNPDELEWKEGDHLPQEMLDQVATMAKTMVMSPEDIAEATIYALSVPENVQVSEIMLRPLMPLPAMPGFSVPA
jgi:NAD(P)-dependent dehydrogenase (short-subunit alcohol dehydrogenase family)